MAEIDKSIIEGFAKDIDEETQETALSSSFYVVETALQELQKHNAFVSKNYKMQLINDFDLCSVTPNSSIDILLLVDNSQIRLNTEALVSKKLQAFWKKLKYAWKHRKKKKKKKRKKKKEEEPLEIPNVTKDEKYTLPAFNRDFLIAITQIITPKDIVELDDNCLTIKGNSFPFNIRVFPVMPKGKYFEVYNTNKNRIEKINFNLRDENLDKLIERYEEKVVNLCKIFSSLFLSVMDYSAEPVMIESLVANLPDKAFEKDDFSNFVFAVNFLLNSKTSKLFSICNPTQTLVQDPLCKTSVGELYKFFSGVLKNYCSEDEEDM